MKNPTNNVLSIDQFNKDRMESIFTTAQNMQAQEWKLFPPDVEYFIEQEDILMSQTMASVFYEPSTRTRLSFEAAFLKLGGKVVTVENAFDNSSSRKGETFTDTIRAISEIADIIVCRHPERDSVLYMAEIAGCPIINAGDGSGEHPSQALIDLYTIRKEKGKIDDLKVAIVGDLKQARTINSFKKSLKNYNTTVVEYELEDNPNPDLSDVDVLYMTRIQVERRGESHVDVKPIDISTLKEDAIILHPLPRGPELPVSVDEDPRAAYWKQVKNSVPVRQSLFLYALGLG